MRLYRLLGIVTCLLNHGSMSARQLAERFEVSRRTIQRDMEDLGLAGIPVVTERGPAGGYRLMDGFRLHGQLVQPADYARILAAVRGLCSAYDDLDVTATLEKLQAVAPSAAAGDYGLQLDLCILREGINTAEDLALLRTAISSRQAIRFRYTDADNRQTDRLVEPLTVLHRWYAWYLFGFCQSKQDYRLFRLSRMRQLEPAGPFTRQHRDAAPLLDEYSQQDGRCYLQICLLCQPELRVAVEERFPNGEYTLTDDGKLLARLSLPENERGWFGWLLSYGNQLLVLSPDSLRQRLAQTAQEIIEVYAAEATAK